MILFVFSKSLFPQSCVNCDGSVLGLLATSSKKAYATPRSVALRAPAHVAGHCWPEPPQETVKHSKVWSQFLWDLPVGTRFCLSPLSISGGLRFDSKCDFAPPTVLLWLLLCPWTWGIFFFGEIQHSPVDGYSAVSFNFGVLSGEDECTSFYSAICEYK